MPLFHSANSRAPLDLPPEAATKDLNDVVFNTGGPVWALDWCPVTADDEGQERAAQFLLVSSNRESDAASQASIARFGTRTVTAAVFVCICSKLDIVAGAQSKCPEMRQCSLLLTGGCSP